MKTYPGICEHCQRTFEYSFIGSGMNGSFHAYCEQCGKAIVTESAVDPNRVQFEPCQCGGRPTYDASPRCPHCTRPLSAEVAAEYIEKNAPGTARGYRWQRTWRGGDTFIVGGNFSYNHPWRAVLRTGSVAGRSTGSLGGTRGEAMDASVEQIVREIEAHLDRHPDASDTAAAIERWWLSRASNRPSTLVAQALETLVARGTVAVHHLPSGISVYRRGRAA